MSNDFRSGVAAIATLASAHTDTAEGLGAVRLTRARLLYDLAQLTNAHGLAAANDGIVRQTACLLRWPWKCLTQTSREAVELLE